MSANTHEVLHEKQISETQKIVAHIISFGGKKPVLAVQHMWRKSKNEEWIFGKIAAINGDLLSELIDKDIFNKANSIIKNLSTKTEA